jgi:putative methyltransferase (TIGR04325 family)
MLKSALHSVTPPLVWNAGRAITHFVRPPPPPPVPPELKTYPTWDAAARASGSYEDQLVNEFRVARAVENRANGVTQPAESSPLFWLTTLLSGIREIVDFGGATGEYGEALCAARAQLAYLVVENPTLVRLMPPVRGLTFTTEMPAACDVFFTSGTLQYLTDPYSVLARGFSTARRAVVLLRNSFSEHELFRVQHTPLFDNGAGLLPMGYENQVITHPHRTISERRVREIALVHGFELLSRMPDEGGLYRYQDLVYGQQLVFCKV